MKKNEYINRLIIFQYITEEQRELYNQKNLNELLQIYLMVINRRIKNNEQEKEKSNNRNY